MSPGKRQVRIGVNASMLDSKPTGVGVFTYNLINHMHRLLEAESRAEFTVFSPVTEHLDADVRIHRIPALVQSSAFPRSSAISRLAWNQLMYPVVASRMDILLNPSTHGHLLPGKQVLTIHDLLSLRFKNISGHQRTYFQKILPWMIRQSAAVITVSECTRQEVIRYFGTPPEKIKVVHNGINAGEFVPDRRHPGMIRNRYGLSDYILAVGPTYPHKNFETLINAYALFTPEERAQFPLLIAGGRSSYITSLKKLTSDAGLAENIHFVGYVPQELMPALYREARMLVFPSLYEGFGIPLLEAMACGCPIVSSNASSMPEVCDKAAIYVDPLKAEEMHSAITAILKQESLQTTLREKGIARSKLFSWERTATQVIKLVKEISVKQNLAFHV